MANCELRIALVGDVDHGKSTIIGRILLMIKTWPEERVYEMQTASLQRGRLTDVAMFTDALSEEREHEMTLDTTQVSLGLETTNLTLIDTPGHEELLGNMISGTCLADAVLFVVDATSEVWEETLLCVDAVRMLGISQIIVAVNKMDLVRYRKEAFEKVRADVCAILRKTAMAPSFTIPISALGGENILTSSNKMKWYKGPHLLSALEAISPISLTGKGAACFPIQYVFNQDNHFMYLGRLEAGTLQTEQRVKVMPTGVQEEIGFVDVGVTGRQRVGKGDSLGVTLKSNRRYERGHILCDPNYPLSIKSTLNCEIICLPSNILRIGEELNIRIGFQETHCILGSSTDVAVRDDLATITSSSPLQAMKKSVVSIKLKCPCIVDTTGRLLFLSRVVLSRGGRVCAFGQICGDIAAAFSTHEKR